MAVLKEKIQQNLKSAMMEKQDTIVSVLRLLSAAVLNKEKDKQYRLSKETGESKIAELSDEEIVDVISQEIKKMRDSLGLFEKGGRQDLVEKTKSEIEILQKYLPEQLTEDEITALAQKAVAKTGAVNIKDMGKVMAEMMPMIRGKADSGLAGSIVKKLLAG